MSNNSDSTGFYASTPPAVFEGFEAYDSSETDFYDQLAQDFPGSILELGCGTGQHLRRLAEKGHTVFGLELAPQLVAAGRQLTMDAESSFAVPPQFMVGDMRSFAIGGKFGLIFVTCGSFYHLLTLEEQISMLTCARQHLSFDGAICVASEIPSLKTWTWDKGPDFRLIEHTERGCQVGEKSFMLRGVRHYNPVTQVCCIAETIFEEAEASITVDRREGRFRFTTPSEMELLCRVSGLRMIRRYGGLYEGNFLPEIPNSDWVIYLMQSNDAEEKDCLHVL
jgi:SAM-dependent methyltransferase